jgi:hypothetical protein
MDDRDRDRPDPTAEPDAGPAAGGRSSAAASEKAENAEVVLDADLEDEDPARDARAEVDRLEEHNRSTLPSPDEG